MTNFYDIAMTDESVPFKMNTINVSQHKMVYNGQCYRITYKVNKKLFLQIM